MQLKYVPVQRPTRSGWQTPASTYADYCSSATLPANLDVCIVGTGFTGIATAWHLLHGDADVEVALMDARQLCSGATGRNGGHLTVDLYSYTLALLNAGYTAAQVVAHAEFELANFHALEALIAAERIDCEHARKRHFDIALTASEFAEKRRNLAAMRDAGGPVGNVRLFEGEHATRLAHTPCAGVVVHDFSASLNPYRLVTGMLAILMRRFPDRLRLYTNTLVTRAAADGAIVTSRGAAQARQVVLATNAYTRQLVPALADVIVPVRGQIHARLPCAAAHGATLTHQSQPAKSRDAGVQNCSYNAGGEYVSQRPDGTLVLGGGRRYGRNGEVDTVDDANVSEDVRRYLSGFAEQHLPSDTTTPAAGAATATAIVSAAVANRHDYGREPASDAAALPELDYGGSMDWTGIMGFTHLGIPVVRQLDERRFVCAGFSGHGMPRIYLSAQGCARQVLAARAGTATQTAGEREGSGLPPGYDGSIRIDPSSLGGCNAHSNG